MATQCCHQGCKHTLDWGLMHQHMELFHMELCTATPATQCARCKTNHVLHSSSNLHRLNHVLGKGKHAGYRTMGDTHVQRIIAKQIDKHVFIATGLCNGKQITIQNVNPCNPNNMRMNATIHTQITVRFHVAIPRGHCKQLKCGP